MKISEIFYSIQGEGKNQGKPCLFIRCAGCNLRCHWCDTEYSLTGGTEMSMEAILGQVRQASPRLVCITGGEPLLQEEGLLPLVASLNKMGIGIEIETNGTLDFSSFQPYASICMDVKCPASGETSDLSLLGKLREADTVKFVVTDEEDCRFAQETITRHRILAEIIVSPVFGTDYTPITQFILAHKLPVRFQVQLHRILGVK